MITKYTPVERFVAAGEIATGIHTGLRKGTEAPSSGPLWQAIAASDDGAWFEAVCFCIDGLESMGYVLCKVEEVADGPPDTYGVVFPDGALFDVSAAARLFDQDPLDRARLVAGKVDGRAVRIVTSLVELDGE